MAMHPHLFAPVWNRHEYISNTHVSFILNGLHGSWCLLLKSWREAIQFNHSLFLHGNVCCFENNCFFYFFPYRDLIENHFYQLYVNHDISALNCLFFWTHLPVSISVWESLSPQKYFNGMLWFYTNVSWYWNHLCHLQSPIPASHGEVVVRLVAIASVVLTVCRVLPLVGRQVLHRDGLHSPTQECLGRATFFFSLHGDVINWKHFPHYWPFVLGIHRSPVNSPHKGQWHGALRFSLICTLNKRLCKQS